MSSVSTSARRRYSPEVKTLAGEHPAVDPQRLELLATTLRELLASTACADTTRVVHTKNARYLLEHFGERALSEFAGAAGAELVRRYFVDASGAIELRAEERGRGRALAYTTLRSRMNTLRLALEHAHARGMLEALPDPWPIPRPGPYGHARRHEYVFAEQLDAARVAQPPRVRRAPTVKAPPHAPVPPGTETLAAAIGWVLRSRGRGRGGRGRAEATQLMHQAHRDHLIAFFGDRAITDFRGAAGYELLLAYVQAEGPEDGGRGLRYCTLRKRLQTLHMALREAVKRGKLDALPPWPETPADSQPRERWLTLDEYLRLRAAIGAPWATWIDLGVWTGQHSSDLNTMTWAMVDLGGGAGAAAGEGRSLWLRRNTKNRATAEWLPMPAELRRNLAALYRSLEPKPAPNECIVGPWKHAGHRLRKACIRLGIAPCSPIDFRRTCATWWIESGGDKEALRKWLGHSGNSSMVERHYSKITPKMLDGGVDALDRAAAEGAR